MSDNIESNADKSYWKKNPVTVTYPDGQTKTFDNWVSKTPGVNLDPFTPIAQASRENGNVINDKALLRAVEIMRERDQSKK